LSGVYFARVLERLEIADQMKPKTILVPSDQSADVVAKGEAEIGVAQFSWSARCPETSSRDRVLGGTWIPRQSV
jgi:molybdate transport system substrate-binding protein